MKKQKKKILLAFGTRPEAIKMAPVVQELKARSDEFLVVVCVTAQHRQMLDDVLDVFKIKPKYDLNIMREDQSLFHVTAAALTRMQSVLEKEKPDMVLVHGDTTTSFAAALAAFYLKIPVGHVEAGLRSHDMDHPFPEEANRRLTDALSSIYFAPTVTAQKTLLEENVDPEKIMVTGNTVIDALQWVVTRNIPVKLKELKKIPAGRSILMTCHRRENFGKPIENIFTAVRTIARKYPDVQIYYPVHLNPNVQRPAQRILGGVKNIHLLPPVNYVDLAYLMDRAHIVLTDSGGIQEEAPSLGKPVLVMREVTERPEAVAAGTVKLVGSSEKKIVSEVRKLLDDLRIYKKMSRAHNPYGDGKAAQRTVEAIRYYFWFRRQPPAEFVARGSK